MVFPQKEHNKIPKNIIIIIIIIVIIILIVNVVELNLIFASYIDNDFN